MKPLEVSSNKAKCYKLCLLPGWFEKGASPCAINQSLHFICSILEQSVFCTDGGQYSLMFMFCQISR